MKLSRTFLVSFLLFSFAWPAFCQIELPAIIGDNMVLQRNASVPLWGWTAPGSSVTIHTDWDGQSYSCIANEDGEWIVNINSPDAGGPYAISISGKEQINIKNILIGEVWLCSGQSNMEMPVEGWVNQPITGSEEYIRSADYPDIRLFRVARKVAYTPEKDCEGQWGAANSETVAKFSATGYFFGLNLYEKLKIPIGLIHSSWGGTPAEAWTSKEYIEKIPHFNTSPDGCDPKEYTRRRIAAHEKIQQEWLQNLGFVSPEKTPKWTQIQYDDSSWESLSVPAAWDDTDLGHFEGAADQRFEIKNFPRRWTKKAVILDLGPIDEMDVTWVNGVKVGEHLNVYDWTTSRSYVIPAGILQKGKNIVSVKIANTSGIGGINGEADRVRIYPEGRSSKGLSLAGRWKYRKAQSFSEVGPMPWCNNCSEPEAPTTLYNGMIAPLIPYKIKGAIWYQGESNRYDGQLYGEIFPNMIENWRESWGQGDFPFYFVQISPYSYSDDFSTGLLREAQLKSMKTKNTGMVVTMDVGSLSTIHPPDKKTVGDRLALWALAKDYGYENLAFSGPIYQGFEIEEGKIRIFFDYSEGGLTSDSGSLKHFTIAGEDGVFVAAKAKIDGKTVVVSSEYIPHPKAVRFGWGHTDMTNLFNQAGLPASPFRTDNFKINKIR